MNGKTATPSFCVARYGGRPRKNVAESLHKGTRVVVQGRLKQRSFETREGEKRTVVELEADEVGVSLRSATAKVSKSSRSSAGGGGNGGNGGNGGPGGNSGGGPGSSFGGGSGGGSPSSAPSDDPWSSSSSSYSDEPPF